MATSKVITAVLAAATLAATLAAVRPTCAYELTTLASFNNDNGQYCYAGLTISPDGSTLYGTTFDQGAYGGGTVFSVSTSPSHALNILASFQTWGSGPCYSTASLVLSSDASTLYGTTQNGGASGLGTVYSLSTSGGTPNVLASFNASTGANPGARVLLNGSKLYGTTKGDGSTNSGTVYSVPVAGGGTPTVLATFPTSSYAQPSGGLTLVNGTLYGTTQGVAGHNYGTIFSVPLTGGTPTTLFTFDGAPDHGAYPAGDLTVSQDGTTLYGTTTGINGMGDGTIFSLALADDSFHNLATLDGGEGGNLADLGAGLLLSADGHTLFGTSYGLVDDTSGTVFAIPTTGGTPNVMVTFTGKPGGGNPLCDPVMNQNDELFGTTAYGGTGPDASGDGTVFEVSLPIIPEPASLGLLGLGAAMLFARRRKHA